MNKRPLFKLLMTVCQPLEIDFHPEMLRRLGYL